VSASTLLVSATEGMRNRPCLRRAIVGLRRLRTALTEAYLTIDTAPAGTLDRSAPRSQLGDAHGFAVLDYAMLRRFMRPLRLGPEDVVMDVGCGTGRTLCLFARRSIKKCIGIECDAELAQIAEANTRRLHGRRCPVEIRMIDAALADYSEPTLFWFFSPFGSATMNRVAERIAQSVKSYPRHIRIVYVSGLTETERPDFRVLLGLQCVGETTAPTFIAGRVSYWG
jgi:SAM-dependent methyltransferase